MSEDEFARETFRPASSMPEPAWNPDAATLLDAGRRRSRIVNTATGTGAVGLTAAVALLAVTAFGSGGPTAATFSAGVTKPGSLPPAKKPTAPVKAATTSTTPVLPPADTAALKLWDASNDTVGGQSTEGLGASVTPTVADFMTLLTNTLDPEHSHLRDAIHLKSLPKIIAQDGSAAKNTTEVGFQTQWTLDGQTIDWLDVHNLTPRGWLSVDVNTTDFNTSVSMCGKTVDLNEPVTWAPCTTTPLSDGSKVIETSAKVGKVTTYDVVRQYPNGSGAIWLQFSDGSVPGDPMGEEVSDPVTPSPWTAQSLIGLLSDSALVKPVP